MQHDLSKPKCIDEIKRVNEFFSKESKKFSTPPKNCSSLHIKEFAASHKYLLIKSLQALYLLNTLAIGARSKSKRPLKVSSSSRASLTKEKRFFPFLIEDASLHDGELTPDRVRGWRFKEFFLAKNQFESLKKLSVSPRKHDIVPIIEKDSLQEDFEKTEEWRKLLPPPEEQFRITRITKIFTK